MTGRSMIDPRLLLYSDWRRLEACPKNLSLSAAGEASLCLRRLLLDQHRLIDVCNKKPRFKIRYPHPQDSDLDRVGIMKDEVHGSIAGPPSLSRNRDLFKIDDYLGLKVLEVDSVPLSVRDVIDLHANKLGGVHYDSSGATEFGIDSLDAKSVDDLISCLYLICRSSVAALRELADYCSPLPKEQDLISQHRIDGHGRLIFESNQFMKMEIKHEIGLSELVVAGVFELNITHADDVLLFSIEGFGGFRFEVGYDRSGDIFARARLGYINARCEVRNDWKLRLIGKRVFIIASILTGDGRLKIDLDVMGRLSEAEEGCPLTQFTLRRAGLGARYEGENGGRFLFWEIVLSRRKSRDYLNALKKYFVLRYSMNRQLN
ncbi:MAG: hypothetical protein QNJ35_11405 [Paracoccaceae bacterium]|nr:hypothetical protein [Paracoccaceae bacterium]